MTYRQFQKDLSRMTAEQLDGEMIVEVNDSFYNIVSVEAASGEGDYLYKNEVFFTVDYDPIGEKTDD